MDEFEVQQTISLYHEAASAADWQRTVSTFVPDGILEITSSGSKFQGHKAICEAFENFTAPLEYVVQINAPGRIVVDGDTANAVSSIRESGKFKDRNEGLEAYGIYRDKLTRTDAGWRFTHRAFDLKWMHRVAILA